MTTETHWGIRYTAAGRSHITDYETDENAARRNFQQQPCPGGRHELLSRTVRIGEWRQIESRDRDG